MIKFKAQDRHPYIQEFEVLRETAKFVTLIGGSRVAKETEDYAIFDTFEEAKEYLVSEAEQWCEGIRNQLERASGQLGHMKGLKP